MAPPLMPLSCQERTGKGSSAQVPQILEILKAASRSRLLSSGSLVLLSPSVEDEGYFECTAVNDVGEERRVIEVVLQGGLECCKTGRWKIISHGDGVFFFKLPLLVPPSIEDDVTTVTAVMMSPVVLPCHVQGRPHPTVTWTKAGAKLGPRGGSYRVLPTGTAAYPRSCRSVSRVIHPVTALTPFV